MLKNGSQKKLEYDRYINSAEWKRNRKPALDRAGGKCEKCRSAGELHVHHLTYARFQRERPSDLLVLCRECHLVAHGLTEGPRERPVKRYQVRLRNDEWFVVRDRKYGRDVARLRRRNDALSFTAGMNSVSDVVYVRSRVKVEKKRGGKRKAGWCKTCGRRFAPKAYPGGGGWYCSKRCKPAKT